MMNLLYQKSKLSKLKVTATVKKHGKYRKVRVVKFKRRKHYMRTQGSSTRLYRTKNRVYQVGKSYGT
ncbi:MAG: hypothetical protein Ct9H90mP18_00590 [Gammaproteobacteria bacterium]|nr:MAG: hypothetical protein Ct9H90mP18_00590 [Gammaproteobacteria bacterium]